MRRTVAVSTETGLAKVIVAAPKRRLEVALPEHLPVAVLLPTLLRQGGEDLPNEGVATGGWLLRRADGVPLDGARTLANQAVRDGEVLHLVPRRTEWPELQYDDVVDAIAVGARQGGPPWTRATTRAFGLTVTALTLLLIPVTVLMSGGHWIGPAVASLVLAVLLIAAGIALSRALSDSVAGAVVGALALPYGLLGGFLLLGGNLPLLEFGAPQLLVGSMTMLVLALIGYFGVAELRRFFVAGIVAGLGGAIGATLSLTMVKGVGASAILVALFLIIGPAFPFLSVRMAKVPLPPVPRDAEDLRGHTFPSLQQTMAQVANSTEILAGALLGAAAITVVGTAVLSATRNATALVLAATVSAAWLIRARMLVAVRQRIAPLVAGVMGLLAAVLGTVVAVPAWARFGLVLPALLLIAVLACVSALVFSRRPPSPYLGRLADISDVLLTLAAGPIAAGILGLYGAMRGMAG
jgi:type VII secretion integral membrane protein EccD